MTETAAEPTPPTAAPSDGLPSPGRLLRTARERAGLGTEDLAGQLKLAKGTLEALERDDFASLSEPVYIRGYYRKIAKLLTTVSEADLINAYNARSAPPPTPQAAMRRIPLAGGVAAGTSQKYRGQGIWVIVGAVIVAGFLFALAGHESPERLKPETPKAEPAAVANTQPAAPTVAPTVETTSPPASTVATAAAPSTPAAAPSPMPMPTPAPTHATPAPAPAPSAAVSHATPAVTPSPAPATPVVKPTQLELQFSESSFIRVEDGRGKTLAIGLVRGGEDQKLEGEPPYTVFIGNAKNVKVTYGGRPVDFSAHVNGQNDTARFTVP